ncbi:MAG: hypothetical protein KDA75_13835 [Planctomycetaceae bacterium]|nr:hypothetical protein [Planctomycetaceae bacterium]
MNQASSPLRTAGGLRRRVLAGGAIGILALGIWLGSWFRGFGLGGGSGGEEVAETDGGIPAAVSPDDVSVDLGQETVLKSPSGNADDEASSAGTLAVLVTGDSYLLAKEPFEDATALPAPLSEHFAPAELSDIVSRAAVVPGTESGIKVRIYQHKSSTVGAYSTLLQALKEAGLDDGAMHRVTGYYD